MTASACGFNWWTQHSILYLKEGVLNMTQRTRIYYTESQKALMWDRWQHPTPLKGTPKVIASPCVPRIARVQLFIMILMSFYKCVNLQLACLALAMLGLGSTWCIGVIIVSRLFNSVFYVSTVSIDTRLS